MHSIRERKCVAEKIQLRTSITVKKVLYFWSLCNVDSAVTVAACSAVDGVAVSDAAAVDVVAVVRVVDVVVVGSAVTMIIFHLSPLLHDRPILQMKNFGSSAF